MYYFMAGILVAGILAIWIVNAPLNRVSDDQSASIPSRFIQTGTPP
jgi:hypothetical protein